MAGLIWIAVVRRRHGTLARPNGAGEVDSTQTAA
jgi:hypothetical protein